MAHLELLARATGAGRVLGGAGQLLGREAVAPTGVRPAVAAGTHRDVALHDLTGLGRGRVVQLCGLARTLDADTGHLDVRLLARRRAVCVRPTPASPPNMSDTCCGAAATSGAGWSTWTSTWKIRPTASSLTDSFMACQSWKPSRWYSTSGSRWAMARRPMPSCR